MTELSRRDEFVLQIIPAVIVAYNPCVLTIESALLQAIKLADSMIAKLDATEVKDVNS